MVTMFLLCALLGLFFACFLFGGYGLFVYCFILAFILFGFDPERADK